MTVWNRDTKNAALVVLVYVAGVGFTLWVIH